MTSQRLRTDDRGVSIAMTHVLTVGITTILITGLLVGVGGLLEEQKDQGATRSLETIGERLVTEITSVDRQAGGGDGTITLRTRHPTRVSGVSYTVDLVDDSSGSMCEDANPFVDDADACLMLDASGTGDTQVIPLTVDADVDNSTVNSGNIVIVYSDGSISLVGDRR